MKFTCSLTCRCERSQLQSKLEVLLHDAISLLNARVTRDPSPGWVILFSREAKVLMEAGQNHWTTISHVRSPHYPHISISAPQQLPWGLSARILV